MSGESLNLRLRWYRHAALNRLNNFDPAEDLLIVSSPRGGSSWLMELIATTPGTAVLWEPLHPYGVRAARVSALRHAWRQHIPENVDWPEARRAFDMILRGKIMNGWTASQTSMTRFLSAKRMLVKFCRVHTMLPWLINNFRFRYAPVYLVRHPFAVVASQLREPEWKHGNPAFVIPDAPHNEFYEQHRAFLHRLSSEEEVRVADWCLSNLYLLRHPMNDRAWITVHYEHLLTEPAREIHRIYKRWQLPVPRNILDKVESPSKTTNHATSVRGVERQLNKWKLFFDKMQIERMTAVLDYFQTEIYCSEDAAPVLVRDERREIA